MGRQRNTRLESVVFDGVRYTRKVNGRYFVANRWDKKKKRYWADSLHRAVWRFHNGEIPVGTHIHHKDENWDNNSISNLECLTRREHMLKHREKFRTPEHIALLARIRSKSVEWTRRNRHTAKFQEVARRRAAAMWATAVILRFICVQCGKKFAVRTTDKNLKAKFCGKICKGRAGYRRKRMARLRRERCQHA